MRVVLAFVALITLGLVAACGGESPPTPTMIAVPTSAVAPAASRQEVYRALDSLSIGLLPLNRHTDDYVSTMLPNADITIDIFGPADRVEAVELSFRRSVPMGTAQLLVEALASTIIPEQQAQGKQWFSDSLELMERTGEQKQQTSVGEMYLTLQRVANLNQYFFSIDVEKE